MATFREALLRISEESGISLRRIAEGAGVSYEQLKKVKQGKSSSTNVDDAVRIAAFLGLTVEQMIEGELPSDRIDLVRALSQLEPEERQTIEKLVEARLDAMRRAQKQSDPNV
ncbi:helix-turn-helix domain-containing protein [Pseudoroseicyclus sp. H15]